MAKSELIEALKRLLKLGKVTTQKDICLALQEMGYTVNQPKVSRLIKKINAIKIINEQGEMGYSLPMDLAPPPIDTALSRLVSDITYNETTLIVKTSPGSASLIARIMDNKKCQIIGTIAGDDTIFIAPRSIKTIKETYFLICSFLGFTPQK